MQDNKKRKWLFIVRRCGRLANRIVLFANVIAFAKERGYQVVNFSFHSYAHYFEGTDDTLLCAYPTKKCPVNLFGFRSILYTWIRKSRLLYQATYMLSKLFHQLRLSGSLITMILGPANGQPMYLSSPVIMEQIKQSRVVLLSGWEFRDRESIKKHAEKIRAYFTPVKELREAIQNRINEIRRNCDLLIGVHIRQGDYRNWMHGRYFYSLEQYADLMRRLQDLYPGKRLKFLVCSDSTLEDENFPGLTVVASKGTPLEDLYRLAHCDMIMGPPSTFSQWASFYGEVPLWHVKDLNEGIDAHTFTLRSIEDIPGVLPQEA